MDGMIEHLVSPALVVSAIQWYQLIPNCGPWTILGLIIHSMPIGNPINIGQWDQVKVLASKPDDSPNRRRENVVFWPHDHMPTRTAPNTNKCTYTHRISIKNLDPHIWFYRQGNRGLCWSGVTLSPIAVFMSPVVRTTKVYVPRVDQHVTEHASEWMIGLGKGPVWSLTEADASANVFRNLLHVGSLERVVLCLWPDSCQRTGQSLWRLRLLLVSNPH